jgi:hypothetical protein
MAYLERVREDGVRKVVALAIRSRNGEEKFTEVRSRLKYRKIGLY